MDKRVVILAVLIAVQGAWLTWRGTALLRVSQAFAAQRQKSGVQRQPDIVTAELPISREQARTAQRALAGFCQSYTVAHAVDPVSGDLLCGYLLEHGMRMLEARISCVDAQQGSQHPNKGEERAERDLMLLARTLLGTEGGTRFVNEARATWHTAMPDVVPNPQPANGVERRHGP